MTTERPVEDETVDRFLQHFGRLEEIPWGGDGHPCQQPTVPALFSQVVGEDEAAGKTETRADTVWLNTMVKDVVMQLLGMS